MKKKKRVLPLRSYEQLSLFSEQEMKLLEKRKPAKVVPLVSEDNNVDGSILFYAVRDNLKSAGYTKDNAPFGLDSFL